MTDAFRLDGRTAVVTGGATGLGRGIAEAFVQAGARVLLAGRRASTGERAAAEMGPPDRVRYVRADASRAGDVQALFAAADDFLGGLDVLVTAAGAMDTRDITDVDDAAIDAMLDANLRSVVHCARTAVPRFLARGGGTMVFLGSYLGIRGGPGGAPLYGAAKGGVIALTRLLAVRYGPQRIRVNALVPGWVTTDLNRHVIESTPHPAATERRFAQEYPLRRLGTPVDIAHAALFLASDAASWITGVVLPVDGGVTAK